MGLSNLWLNLEREWQEVNVDELKDASIAIDGQIWLYESWREVERGLADSYLSAFHAKIDALLKLRITPFVVFDQYQSGSLPKSNMNESARLRSEYQFVRDLRPAKVTEGARMRYGRNTTKMRNLHRVTELLDAMGVRYFKSKGVDNEAAGSFLEDQGKVVGFVSPDADYFMYGGKQLLKIEFDATFKVSAIKKLTADILLQKTGLTRGRLIALGTLLGCDYWPKKMSGIGIVSALEIVSAFSIDEDDHPCSILDRFRNFCDPEFKAKAEETPPRAKLKMASYAFDDFNSSSDAFGEAVDAYMWPNLEDLPYEMDRTIGAKDERRIQNLLSQSIGTSSDAADVSTDSVESRKSSRITKGEGESMSGVKRRGPPIGMNGEGEKEKERGGGGGGGAKKRNVVISCTRNEAIAWSKREWEAILLLRRATTRHVDNDNGASGSRPSGSLSNGISA